MATVAPRGAGLVTVSILGMIVKANCADVPPDTACAVQEPSGTSGRMIVPVALPEASVEVVASDSGVPPPAGVIVMVTGLLAGTAILSGRLFQPVAQIFELRQRAFETLLALASASLGKLLGFLGLLFELVKRPCDGLLTLGSVIGQAPPDILGANPQPGGQFCLLDVADCFPKLSRRVLSGGPCSCSLLTVAASAGISLASPFSVRRGPRSRRSSRWR